MGKLFYGHTDQPIDIPDRILAHLKVVVTTKLRRGESFTLSWRHPDDQGDGRTTIWLQPAIPLRFVFAASEPGELDPAFMQELAVGASSAAGLTVDLSRKLSSGDVARAA